MAITEQNAANVFALSNKYVQISYATTGITGEPQLSYTDQQRQLSFSGDEIRTVPTEIGSLVTVTLEQIPDLHTITLSLLIPTINSADAEISFRTRAILTTHHTSIAGPQLVQGPLQTYETIALRGTAQFVDFRVVLTP